MWGEYVPVSVRHARAKKEMEKLRKKGLIVEPIEVTGRKITQKFWGNKWCDHLENFADYENRLERGRTYVRNGSICHLSIQKGCCEAIVSGSEIYKVSVTIKTLIQDKWERIKKLCSGKIASILELLQGKISHHVMEIVADQNHGLFPDNKEMNFKCSCPDFASMCKHVAAVLYGIGNRLDNQPELLFQLRGVDPTELISMQISVDIEIKANELGDEDLGDIFGIEIETTPNKKNHEEIVPTLVKKEKQVKKSKIKQIKIPDINALTGIDLKSFRIKKGYTVNEFAEALGMTCTSVYRWEQNPKILNLQTRTKKEIEKILAKKAVIPFRKNNVMK